MEKQRHILIVDDDENARKIIQKYAAFENYKVSQAQDGVQAINFCRNNECDIVTMDIVMPHLDGFTACKEIRKKSDVPIVMVSARMDNFDIIHGYEVGADDYVTKPFSPRILFLKIEAILKRTEMRMSNHEVMVIDDGLKIDFTSRVVKVDDKIISQTPKEYELLFYLVKNKGVVLKRRLLIERIWGNNFKGDERTLDTHIKLLRKNLGDYGKKIITLRGVGYRFDE